MTELKYELTGATRKVNGITVHRVGALRSVVRDGRTRVRGGMLGGWIESERNLSQAGDCWVGGSAVVTGHALVTGNAYVRGEVTVSADAQVYDDAQLFGGVTVTDAAEVYGHAKMHGLATVGGAAHVRGNAQVYGQAVVDGSARVGGNGVVSWNAHVTGIALVRDARLRHHAVVGEPGHVVTLTGLTCESVTLYRAPSQPYGHLVVVGCQLFSLGEAADGVSAARIEALAADNEWELAPGWRHVRLGLLELVEGWKAAAGVQDGD